MCGRRHRLAVAGLAPDSNGPLGSDPPAELPDELLEQPQPDLIDTPNDWQYYRHGGILHFMLRQLAG